MKYLTKGELLLALGSSANAFTAFMMNPEQYGITEPNLNVLRVEKQKLDWTAGVDVGLPETERLISLLQSIGVISPEDADNVRNTPDKTEYDQYVIYVKAQTEITYYNMYGSIFDGTAWKIVVDFHNVTAGIHTIEDIYFNSEPTEEEIKIAINKRVAELKRV